MAGSEAGERVEPERALDELYAVSPEEFVSRREALARRLRAQGDRATAEALRKLRRPSAVVYAANRLARQAPAELARLLDAAAGLRSAHESGEDLREASVAYGRSLKVAVGEALRLVPNASPERLAGTLRGASADDEQRELLQRGRLQAELAPSGFEAFGPLSAAARTRVEARLVEGGRPPAATKQPPAAADAAREARAREPAPVDRAAAERRARAEALERAREQAAERRREALGAAARARELQAAARAAEREASLAKGEAQRTRREAEQRRREAERAEAQAEAAAHQAERLTAKARRARAEADQAAEAAEAAAQAVRRTATAPSA